MGLVKWKLDKTVLPIFKWALWDRSPCSAYSIYPKHMIETCLSQLNPINWTNHTEVFGSVWTSFLRWLVQFWFWFYKIDLNQFVFKIALNRPDPNHAHPYSSVITKSSLISGFQLLYLHPLTCTIDLSPHQVDPALLWQAVVSNSNWMLVNHYLFK